MNYYKSMQAKIFFFCCFIFIATIVYGQHFTTIKSDEGIEISENHKKVLFYQVRPKSVDGKYERAGFIHPLYSFNEKILTEDMPNDHPYHHGIFWVLVIKAQALLLLCIRRLSISMKMHLA